MTLLKDGAAKQFKKGIGAHAPSTLIFNIDGKEYEKFESYVGTDYSQGTSGNGQVNFKVFLDGVESFNSGTIAPSDECKFISLDIIGVKEVKLVVEEGANNWNDHAVWADAKFKASFDVVDIFEKGDLNKDGKIDIKDLAIASKNYNMSIPEYDLNDDGVVGAYEVDYISGKILE
ncbi:NPCBM/NEW2 domain-containing protein [Clostridium septicum]|uniref:NPCBM/NEW2 domain-containing protein n=1 Tax=Clostridium septicum TaxID=1504 RepID=UPI00243184C1|nr:NPCBM/NEW2 domain-containing protein [Clostridium septicum]